jgi:hypothetical protein
MDNTDSNTYTFDAALARFLRGAQDIIDAYYARHFPTLRVPRLSAWPGRRYIRIVLSDAVQRSCHCFVDRTNGAILKPDGWKRPAQGARGNIYTGAAKDAVGPHGALYLR